MVGLSHAHEIANRKKFAFRRYVSLDLDSAARYGPVGSRMSVGVWGFFVGFRRSAIAVALACAVTMSAASAAVAESLGPLLASGETPHQLAGDLSSKPDVATVLQALDRVAAMDGTLDPEVAATPLPHRFTGRSADVEVLDVLFSRLEAAATIGEFVGAIAQSAADEDFRSAVVAMDAIEGWGEVIAAAFVAVGSTMLIAACGASMVCAGGAAIVAAGSWLTVAYLAEDAARESCRDRYQRYADANGRQWCYAPCGYSDGGPNPRQC